LDEAILELYDNIKKDRDNIYILEVYIGVIIFLGQIVI
jgi:hypothetical protein